MDTYIVQIHFEELELAIATCVFIKLYEVNRVVFSLKIHLCYQHSLIPALSNTSCNKFLYLCISACFSLLYLILS